MVLNWEAHVSLRYHTVDVFTRTRFGGNPLAVVIDADGLTTKQMQVIAREFNYSESSFVLRPSDERHTANVRIFTSTVEVPFAGHPNVGTAFVRASLGIVSVNDEYVFEEKAGLVRACILRDGENIMIQITAPQPLSIGKTFDSETIANCLSLTIDEISCEVHPPRVVSVGLPFLVVELANRKALERATVHQSSFERILPEDGVDSIYFYSREIHERDGAVDFTARMFAPFDTLPEDPATGSATAATCVHSDKGRSAIRGSSIQPSPNSASFGAIAHAVRRSQPWLASTINRSPSCNSAATGRSEPRSVSSPKPTF
ncbi:MAG: hypothetical protein CFE32_19535, partial [Alphaproteobacteria bacterium PA3]